MCAQTHLCMCWNFHCELNFCFFEAAASVCSDNSSWGYIPTLRVFVTSNTDGEFPGQLCYSCQLVTAVFLAHRFPCDVGEHVTDHGAKFVVHPPGLRYIRCGVLSRVHLPCGDVGCCDQVTIDLVIKGPSRTMRPKLVLFGFIFVARVGLNPIFDGNLRFFDAPAYFLRFLGFITDCL